MASIILVEPEVPENTGFIARLASNFEFSLRIVNPDFNLSEARETASNAQEKLREAEIFDSVEAAIDGLGYVAGTKPGRGMPLESFEPRENTSYMLGRESSGLSSEELELCDSVVHIETPGYGSINLSHAAAVLMYASADAGRDGMKRDQIESIKEKTSGITRELLLRSNPTEREARKLLSELYGG